MNNILIALLITVVFIASDFIYKLKYKNYIQFHKKTIKDMIVIFILNIFILSFPSFSIQFISFEIIIFFIFIQQFHYAFFRSYLMPYEIVLFFLEGEEIVDTLKNTIKYMLLPIFIFSILSLTIYSVLDKYYGNLFHFEYAGLILLIIILLGSLKIGFSAEYRL